MSDDKKNKNLQKPDPAADNTDFIPNITDTVMSNEYTGMIPSAATAEDLDIYKMMLWPDLYSQGMF